MAAAVSSCEVANAAGRSRRATSPSAMGRSAKTPLPFLGSSHACVCTRASSPRAFAKSKSIVSRAAVVGGCGRDGVEVSPLRRRRFFAKAASAPAPKPPRSGNTRVCVLRAFVVDFARSPSLQTDRFGGSARHTATGGRRRASLDRTARGRCIVVASSSRSPRRSWRSRSPRARRRLPSTSRPPTVRLAGIAPTPFAPSAGPSTPPSRAPPTTTAAADSSATTTPPRLRGPPLRHRPPARFREGARLLLRGRGSGHPPRRFQLIVDTGSTLTYVPCVDCGAACGAHTGADPFDPDASTTCAPVRCNTADCHTGGCDASTGADACAYARNYAERSSVRGRLMKDVIHLGGHLGDVEIVFGCTTRESGSIHEQEADGLMGLGNGENPSRSSWRRRARATARFRCATVPSRAAARSPSDAFRRTRTPSPRWRTRRSNPIRDTRRITSSRPNDGSSATRRWRPPRRSPRVRHGARQRHHVHVRSHRGVSGVHRAAGRTGRGWVDARRGAGPDVPAGRVLRRVRRRGALADARLARGFLPDAHRRVRGGRVARASPSQLPLHPRENRGGVLRGGDG